MTLDYTVIVIDDLVSYLTLALLILIDEVTRLWCRRIEDISVSKHPVDLVLSCNALDLSHIVIINAVAFKKDSLAAVSCHITLVLEHFVLYERVVCRNSICEVLADIILP